jgi:hypothetical protein
MKRLFSIFIPLVCLVAGAFAQATAGLHGIITDPSGGRVPGALIQLRGPGPEQRATTNGAGEYSFASLRPGKYRVRAIAKGFSVAERRDFEINGRAELNLELAIEGQSVVVDVEEGASRGAVSVDPTANASAIILGPKQLEALSDDPDELQRQLQIMAGPGAGPSGGQIYIDGFSNGQIPPKSSIREVRINSNPFTPEYDKPGMGRIEIFTKPGSDAFHGTLVGQYNKEALNSRSPLLTQSKRPQYKQELGGVSVTGPVKKQKASFGFDLVHRRLTENAFILATTLDSNLTPTQVNQTALTPQILTTSNPRLDYSINTNNNLSVRYQLNRVSRENQGVGDFSLASRGYDQKSTNHVIQMTETAILGPTVVTETRFQWVRSSSHSTGDSGAPALYVQGAFNGGGAQVGNSGSDVNNLELANVTTYVHRAHTYKWGFRARETYVDSTAMSNFGGSFTYLAGYGPALGVDGLPIPGGALAQLPALEVYRRTLLLGRMDYSDSQIRAGGGGAYLFSRNGGAPTTSVKQFDIGLFANDDWRIRPNLTFSYGLRYEAQSNFSDRSNFAPRFGLAWAPGARGAQQKLVLRAGAGIFFDRLSEGLTLSALRFNGLTQQSYLISNPDFFPAIPQLAALSAARLPQQLQLVDPGARSPRSYQTNIGADRQINKFIKLSANYTYTRGVHAQRARDINAPIGGLFPWGDRQLRNFTETTGLSSSHQLMLTPTVNYKKLMLFGYYVLSFSRTNAEGQPMDPYNLRAEWGPSSSDMRHIAVIGTRVMLPLKLSVLPYFLATSGRPYTITSGRDLNGDTITAERPAFLAGLGQAQCGGADLTYRPGYGCFNLNPPAGLPVLGRNTERGPGSWNFLIVSVSRTWALTRRDARAASPTGSQGSAAGGATGSAVAAANALAQAQVGGGAGRYSLTLLVNATNPLNHTSYLTPSGDLSSPYFGVFRSSGGLLGASSYNRKVDLQLRLSF